MFEFINFLLSLNHALAVVICKKQAGPLICSITEAGLFVSLREQMLINRKTQGTEAVQGHRVPGDKQGTSMCLGAKGKLSPIHPLAISRFLYDSTLFIKRSKV